MAQDKNTKARNALVQRLGYVPEAIITNIGEDFFKKTNKGVLSTEGLLRWYLGMNGDEDRMFYHFISSVPIVDITEVYICFDKHIQLKAKVAHFVNNETIELPGDPKGIWSVVPRCWMITCGPVVKAPEPLPMRGFQGFRYTKPLF